MNSRGRKPPTARLVAARDAIAKDELGRALAALLEAWRATPALAIADAIDAISERASAGLAAPTAKTAKDRAAAWDALAVAGDLVVRGMLVRTLTDTKGNADTLARIELLVAHPPDPRVSAKLCDLVQVPIYNVTVGRTRAFWRRVFPLLAELGDPRIGQRARGFVATWAANRELNEPERPELAKQLAKVQPALDAAYAAGPPPLDPSDAALCHEIIATIRPPPPVDGRARATAEDLLAAIYAAPDDDDARLVYADWLQQTGDPRGEFIVLQIAKARRRLTPKVESASGGWRLGSAQSARERDLLAELGARWIAPLPLKKSSVKFERGFVVAGRTDGWLDEQPAWATIREIDSVPASDACHVAALRVIDSIGNAGILQLAKLTKPLAVEELVWNGPTYWSRDWVDARPAIDAFGEIRVLPRLRRLALVGQSSWTQAYDRITPTDLRWAWSSPHLPALEELTLPADPSELATWLAALAPTRLRRIELHSEGADWGTRRWRTILSRDPDGALSQLDLIAPATVLAQTWVERSVAVLCIGIEALPPTLTSVRVAIPAPTWETYAAARARLAKAFARHSNAGVLIESARA